MYRIVLYADPQTGVWNYSQLDGQEVLVATGPVEGYDSYQTALDAVTREFPGALIAVPPADTVIADGLLATAAAAEQPAIGDVVDAAAEGVPEGATVVEPDEVGVLS